MLDWLREGNGESGVGLLSCPLSTSKLQSQVLQVDADRQGNTNTGELSSQRMIGELIKKNYRWFNQGVTQLPQKNPSLKYYFAADTAQRVSKDFQSHAAMYASSLD